MQLLNRTGKTTLVQKLEVPRSPLARMKGLLGRKVLPEGSGMLITSCRWVHTIGMRFAIDLVFLDGDLKVVGCRPALKPWRFSNFCFKAKHTLELPAGTISRTDTQINDQLEMIG